jgi:hypothetical protein
MSRRYGHLLEVLGVRLVGHLGLVGPDTGNEDSGNTNVEAAIRPIPSYRSPVF